MKWLILAALLAPAAQAETILTGHPAAESLARSLTQGTSIQVVAVQPHNLPASRLSSYLAGRGRQGLEESAKTADAVLSFRSFWPEDPLYPAARRANIRIIEIDAAQPLDNRMPGMAVLDPSSDDRPIYALLGLEPMPPHGEETAPWLSPSRLAEMADTTAGDLSRLAPAEADRIEQNLSRLKHDLLEIRVKADRILALRDNLDVVALSPQFGYLAADLGLDLRACIIAAPNEWSPERAQKLTQWLLQEDITTVLTSRDLTEPLAQHLAQSGFTVLTLGGTGTDELTKLIGDMIGQLE